MDQQTIPRLKEIVVNWISRESFAEIDTQNFHRAVGLSAEELCGVQRGILCDPACQDTSRLSSALRRRCDTSRALELPRPPRFLELAENRSG